MSKYDELKKEIAVKNNEYGKNIDKLLAKSSLTKREKQKIRIKFKIDSLLR
ncbi:hypothetical protein [Lacticigenium naphthae]|uniref:hypothetical protein n=1 Tax=Lacticigenium naphthae TaxID=515351 RepID=UPI000414329A|nr:hypothetical protein [Lacticigenium naphthae]